MKAKTALGAVGIGVASAVVLFATHRTLSTDGGRPARVATACASPGTRASLDVLTSSSAPIRVRSGPRSTTVRTTSAAASARSASSANQALLWIPVRRVIQASVSEMPVKCSLEIRSGGTQA